MPETHNQRKIPVIMDDRECAGAIPGALRDSGRFDVSITRLKTGDYRVDERFLFERKTLPDLAASVISGRLFKQALRLAAKSQQASHLLQSFPGIGPARARNLVDRFGNVQAVMNANEEELAAVPGIGKSTARGIRWLLEEAPQAYRP